jgi:hypothetical protein
MEAEITRVHSDPAIGRGLYGAPSCGTSCAAKASRLPDAGSIG